MALISLRQLLDHAAENAYGVPAFNVNNLEQIQAIMQAADACASPVIMQVSAGGRKYAGAAVPGTVYVLRADAMASAPLLGDSFSSSRPSRACPAPAASQPPPNTARSRSLPRASGLARICASCSAITANRPSRALAVT